MTRSVAGGGWHCVAAEQRFDHPPHTVFFKLVHELVEMDDALQNELFPDIQNVAIRTRTVLVPSVPCLEASPFAERSDEPRLPAGLSPYALDRFG